ncbi:uncharacterized protein [Coffea arabica]|uniref:Endonuclease/exonuclease/phosphatase domain-containing protein n=1 Tax=Coffea arabica TaxID=13443 RepID=A0A6P6URS0_COFAR|nr:uncharacterized protein LOC113713901 [Coffea arabica]
MVVSFPSGANFAFSGIYAKCTRVGRRPLWDAMESISINTQGAWIAAGDFNVISAAEERVGGSPANVRNMEEFNSSMFNCGLASVDFDGQPFTWTNGVVWQRLDRALTNAAWVEAYPINRVSHLARGRSDHSPLLIKCCSTTQTSSAFRFLNVWSGHAQYPGVVKEAWETMNAWKS